MATKAQKLKVKRANRVGRPRKDGERYPSGDRKQSELERDALSVGIEARGRVHSLPSRDPRVGYVLGRLNMDGQISDEQLEAGNEFALAIARYHAVTGITFPSARAQDIFKVHGKEGEVSDEAVHRAIRASNKMMELRGVLQRCKDGPQVCQTVFNVCVMDYDHMRHMPEVQLGWLKRGLDALHVFAELKKTGKPIIKFG